MMKTDQHRDDRSNYLATAAYFDTRAAKARADSDRERFRRAAQKYRDMAAKSAYPATAR